MIIHGRSIYHDHSIYVHYTMYMYAMIMYDHHYISPTLHDVSLNDQLYLQLGMYQIRKELFSQPLSQMNVKYNSCLENSVTNPNSNQCKLIFK